MKHKLFLPVPPAVLLTDIMHGAEMNEDDIANISGLSRIAVHELLENNLKITPYVAKALQRVFPKYPADVLLAIEEAYERGLEDMEQQIRRAKARSVLTENGEIMEPGNDGRIS